MGNRAVYKVRYPAEALDEIKLPEAWTLELRSQNARVLRK